MRRLVRRLVEWLGISDKTGWKWIELLGVPLMLAVAAGIFTILEMNREDARAIREKTFEDARILEVQMKHPTQMTYN